MLNKFLKNRFEEAELEKENAVCFLSGREQTTEKMFVLVASPIKHADDTLTAVCRFHFIKPGYKKHSSGSRLVR